VNDIDLKNFNVQGVGTISSISVTVPSYMLNPGSITLNNPSNTFNSSTIEYSFTPAAQTGGVQFPITYTVQVVSGMQPIQTLTILDPSGNPTSEHQPNTIYTHDVSSTPNTGTTQNTIDNSHVFFVTAVDSNGQTIGGYNFTNSIITYALQSFSVPSPTLAINTNTSSSLIINFNATAATGGVPPYSYSGTWSYGPYTGNLTGIIPGVNVPVNITPIPSQNETITFNLNAVDSVGNATSSSENISVSPVLTLTLPSFAFTHTVTQQFIDLDYPASSGNIYTMLMFNIDVQPAINILPNSSGVDYEITELYYIDDTGAQVDIQRTTNSNLLTPPYGLQPIPPINLVYYFDTPPGQNIITYPTPTSINAAVALGTPVIIAGVLLPNDLGQGFTTDVYCTVTATDTGAIVATQTETQTITI
jgi:hypothetical protein